MKRIIFSILIMFPVLFNECRADQPAGAAVVSEPEEGVTQLTNDTFKKFIFNYEAEKEWKFSGKKPVIIDFYADWCAPCRQLSPLIEEIAKEYSDKIDVYKVDTEKEKTLARNLGITGLPTILFIPVEGSPRVAMGALPKESLVQAITEVLKVTK